MQGDDRPADGDWPSRRRELGPPRSERPPDGWSGDPEDDPWAPRHRENRPDERGWPPRYGDDRPDERGWPPRYGDDRPDERHLPPRPGLGPDPGGPPDDRTMPLGGYDPYAAADRPPPGRHREQWAFPPADPREFDPRTQILDTAEPRRPRRGRRRYGLVSVVGAVAFGLIAAGGVYAYQLLSGGGAQPEEYVPADAIAFIKVDLDPAAGQKLAARDFFSHFPGAAEAFEGNDDIRKMLFELAQRDDEALAALDYEEDIEPWLGDRVGVGVLPTEGEDDPPTIVVLQVRDANRAEEGLRELAEATDSDEPAVVFAGDYAILGEDQAVVEDARAAAAEASLADDEQFSADIDAFGDGVGAFWVDLERVGDIVRQADPAIAESPGLRKFFNDVYTGRIAGLLSFDSDYAELEVRGFDSTGLGIPPSSAQPVGSLFETLPSDTLFVAAWSGLDETVASAWDSIMEAVEEELGAGSVEAELAQIEAELGIRLPDDLLTLLGNQTVLAVAADSSDAPPTIAYRAETDGAAAEEVLGVLEEAMAEFGVPLPLVWEVDGSTLLVGATQADLSAIQSGTGIADPAAATALPDLDEAVQAMWIDLDGIIEVDEETAGLDAEDLEVVQHIAGIGVTATVSAEGDWTTTLRVVAD